MNTRRSSRTPVGTLLLATCFASGCLSEARVGTSGEGLSAAPASASSPPPLAAVPPVLPPLAQASAAPRATHTTKISGDDKQFLGSMQFIAGDLDGDGFDDVVLVATRWIDIDALGPDAETQNPEAWERFVIAGDSSAYIFYGRHDFPEQLSLHDADAVISDAVLMARPLGDVNGDGLADLGLEGLRWASVVFGTRTRLHGEMPAATLGAHWAGPSLPPEVVAQGLPLIEIGPAGDVDADGCADLLMTVATQFSVRSTPGDDPNSWSSESSLTQRSYLVLGHRDAWLSGAFDPASAVAEFAAPPGASAAVLASIPANPRAAGDLDGDGNADLIADNVTNGWTTQLIFYGGPGRLSGTLGAANADALTPPPDTDTPYYTYFAPIGDLDGDGRTDLTYMSPSGMHVFYGSSTRWSGTLPRVGDLVIKAEAPLNPLAAWAADVDGDAHPDLVLGTHALGPDARAALYVMRGSDERRIGITRLTSEQIVVQGTQSEAPTGALAGDVIAFGVQAQGDVNGDGSADVLTGGPGHAVPQGYVLLIPSSPSTPQ